MKVKITKIIMPDGFEIPIRGYLYTSNNNLIGGELTPAFRMGKNASLSK